MECEECTKLAKAHHRMLRKRGGYSPAPKCPQHTIKNPVPPKGPGAASKKSLVCSACGSSAPHHLAFVREKGLCVV